MMTLDKEKDYVDIMEVIDSMEGHLFESFCAELLEKNGFRDVTVTRGSGDYGVDITARYHNRIYGIQCKRYAKSVGIRAVQEALSGYDYYKCDIVAVLTNSTFTPQAVKQANISGVKLWDRNTLIDFIDNCKKLDFVKKYEENCSLSEETKYQQSAEYTDIHSKNDSKKGRQMGRKETARNIQCLNQDQASKQPKRKTWLWVVGWICIFPLSVTFLLLRKKEMNPIFKYGIILISWIVYIVILVSGNSDSAIMNGDTMTQMATGQTAIQQEQMEPSSMESSEQDKQVVDDKKDESAVYQDEDILPVVYDELQNIFLKIDKDIKAQELEDLIGEYNLKYTVKDYNGTLKSTVYKIAYEDGVAVQSYADEGDHLEVRFSKEDGSLMNAEYYNSLCFMIALYYSYGIHWEFREERPDNDYSGYYYHKPGDTEDGITMIYSNGNKVETGYHSCIDGVEALKYVVGK